MLTLDVRLPLKTESETGKRISIEVWTMKKNVNKNMKTNIFVGKFSTVWIKKYLWNPKLKKKFRIDYRFFSRK